MSEPSVLKSEHSERFYTILLSFIPGLGHFKLGLMQRGLSFLVAFFGLLTIILIVLKLLGKISISWLWVFSPLIAGVGIFILVVLFIFIGFLIATSQS